MEEEAWEKRRKRVLDALGNESVKFISREVRQPGPGKPNIEDVVGEIQGIQAIGRWYHLPYQKPDRLICPPVALGCQVRKWGQARGWKSGCRFCAVGRSPYERPMSASEIKAFVGMILDNASCSRHFWKDKDQRFVLSFTSAGEPFLNYDAVMEAARSTKELFGQDLFITIVTSGILRGIKRLTEQDSDLGVQLRLSLHFPTDEERKKYMPMVDSLEDVLGAGLEYAKKTGIALVLNWALIRGINDQERHVKYLARLLKGKEEHVLFRVSRLNPYGGTELLPSSKAGQRRFIAWLKRGAIPVVSAWRGFSTLACETRHFVP